MKHERLSVQAFRISHDFTPKQKRLLCLSFIRRETENIGTCLSISYLKRIISLIIHHIEKFLILIWLPGFQSDRSTRMLCSFEWRSWCDPTTKGLFKVTWVSIMFSSKTSIAWEKRNCKNVFSSTCIQKKTLCFFGVYMLSLTTFSLWIALYYILDRFLSRSFSDSFVPRINYYFFDKITKILP